MAANVTINMSRNTFKSHTSQIEKILSSVTNRLCYIFIYIDHYVKWNKNDDPLSKWKKQPQIINLLASHLINLYYWTCFPTKLPV